MAFVTIDIYFQKDPQGQNSYDVDARIKGVTSAYREVREASEKISINFEEWKNLAGALKSLDAHSRGTQEENQVKEFGKSLFQQVISGKVHALYKNGKDYANSRGLIFRLRLHLGLPELIVLPWEILCEEGIFLGLTSANPRILIIRCPTNIGPTKAVKRLSPLQIMIMAAEPKGHPAGAKDEKERIREALINVEAEGYVSLKEIAGTDTELANIHINRTIDIFHFIGHGQFNSNTGESELVIENESRNVTHISAEKFALSLPHSVRLVILNACESARGNASESYSSIGYLLAKRGYVVIAMQFRISIDAAVHFADNFYSEIGKNKSIEEAVAEARVRVFTMPDCHPLDWAAPVLYMKSDAGKLFEIKAPAIVDDEDDTKNGGSTGPAPKRQGIFLPAIMNRWKRSSRRTKILASVLLLVLILTIAAGIKVTLTTVTDKGLNLVKYCVERQYESAEPVPNTVNWRCVGGKSEKVDLARICNQDYRRSDLTPSVNEKDYVVSCFTSTKVRVGGLDSNLEQFCQEKRYDTYDNKSQSCISPPTSAIDIAKACNWQYKSANINPPTLRKSGNHNSWVCHVRTFFGFEVSW